MYFNRYGKDTNGKWINMKHMMKYKYTNCSPFIVLLYIQFAQCIFSRLNEQIYLLEIIIVFFFLLILSLFLLFRFFESVKTKFLNVHWMFIWRVTSKFLNVAHKFYHSSVINELYVLFGKEKKNNLEREKKIDLLR